MNNEKIYETLDWIVMLAIFVGTLAILDLV